MAGENNNDALQKAAVAHLINAQRDMFASTALNVLLDVEMLKKLEPEKCDFYVAAMADVAFRVADIMVQASRKERELTHVVN